MQTPTSRSAVPLLVALVVAIQIDRAPDRAGAGCDALRMINLDAPQMALQGDTIRLTCSFSLSSEPARGPRRTPAAGADVELAGGGDDDTGDAGDERSAEAAHRKPRTPLGTAQFERRKRWRRQRRATKKDTDTAPPELLYAIKWYKDEREFYQFVSMDWPHKRALPLAGLNTDVDKSDNQTVVLKSVSLKTSGLFRCEVSTDAPSFVTKSIERKISVYSLPAEGPVIETGLTGTKPSQLNLDWGDQLEFRCVSRESKPSPELDWVINGTWNLTANNPTRPDGLPLFNVTNRRFVRMPLPAQPRTRNHSAAAGWPAQQPLGNETIMYELVAAEGGRSLAIPLDGAQSSSSGLHVSPDALDHFMESSMTILNFSVDVNLAHYLKMLSPKNGPPALHKSEFGGRNSISINRTSQVTSFKTKKVSVDRRRLNSNRQLDADAKVPLDIRCVARVMHLTMLDEIKLRVVNRTRSVRNFSTSEAQRQGSQSNSSG